MNIRTIDQDERLTRTMVIPTAFFCVFGGIIRDLEFAGIAVSHTTAIIGHATLALGMLGIGTMFFFAFLHMNDHYQDGTPVGDAERNYEYFE
ncbi:MAG: hypothetical protein Q8Q39_04410 [bacterium]|nr:hypothetical protein [bacterium]